ncbi:MAG: hypothetical protein ACLQBD_15870 [Syntrophobacteraceae bacterium]
MIVTAWNNGKTGYGIKMKATDRDKLFRKEWKSVTLEFENSPVRVEVNLSESFWNRCREIRKKEIREWLQSNGFDSWTKGEPPSLWLEPLGGQRFLLCKLPPKK